MFVYYILRPTSERTTSISPSFNHTWSIGGTGEKVFKVWQSWYVQMKCCWWGTWMNVVVWKTLGACLMEKKQISVSLMARIIGSLWIALLPSCPCYCQVWRWGVDPGFPTRDSGSDHYLNTESSICSTLQIWQKQFFYTQVLCIWPPVWTAFRSWCIFSRATWARACRAALLPPALERNPKVHSSAIPAWQHRDRREALFGRTVGHRQPARLPKEANPNGTGECEDEGMITS